MRRERIADAVAVIGGAATAPPTGRLTGTCRAQHAIESVAGMLVDRAPLTVLRPKMKTRSITTRKPRKMRLPPASASTAAAALMRRPAFRVLERVPVDRTVYEMQDVGGSGEVEEPLDLGSAAHDVESVTSQLGSFVGVDDRVHAGGVRKLQRPQIQHDDASIALRLPQNPSQPRRRPAVQLASHLNRRGVGPGRRSAALELGRRRWVRPRRFKTCHGGHLGRSIGSPERVTVPAGVPNATQLLWRVDEADGAVRS